MVAIELAKQFLMELFEMFWLQWYKSFQKVTRTRGTKVRVQNDWKSKRVSKYDM